MNTLIYILILPFVASFVGFYIGLKNESKRDSFNVMVTAIEFLLIILLYPQIKDGPIEYMMPHIMGTGLHLKVDMLRYSMIFISGLAWFLTTLYATQYLVRKKNRNRFYLFFMLTYATTLGVFISENFLNLFTFFEAMSFTSYFLIIHDEDQYSHKAGMSYLSMAIAGGLVMLMGIFIAFDQTGTLDIGEMGVILPMKGTIKYVISGLIMVGFMIKASVFPLHTWLSKAYPAAPAPATALLSGVLLKTGLFGMIIVVVELMNYDSTISTVLYVLGLINIFLGGILALYQRNIKRIIAYSSLSQTGFMLMGIGLIGILGSHGGIAFVGTILYMINHAIFKVLLFMATGLIFMILNELSINVIKGFGREKTTLKAIFLIGALGLSAAPGFNGFVSKTLLHDAILEAYHYTHNPLFKVSEVLYLIGGGLTIAYMLKLYIALFIDKNEAYYGQYKEHLKKRALFPMGMLATLVVYLGLFPKSVLAPLFDYVEMLGLEYPHSLPVYNAHSIGYFLFSLSVGVLTYVLFIKRKLVKVDEQGKTYLNPSMEWYSLEEDVYVPVVRFFFKAFSFLFRIVDNMLLFSLSVVSNGFKKIIESDIFIIPKLEWKRSMIDTSTEDFRHEIEDTIKGIEGKVAANLQPIKKIKDNLLDEENSKVKELIAFFHYKTSSITYSIFVIAVVLVMSLSIVFLMG
ncbi:MULTISPECIES: complex I subunit 5 family protein [unclassified Fusibacter]|uniref:complex I subunit 5 family protein n=1 Tax=unclassified Fusibacter TaxID=2624464 RepID=UPI0010121044|nr:MULTISPECIES: complex I subunit 5 family protein [unclassified Fusibacter]MCK8061077.1 complex I subunit 5 family protein [Fusibacter sp. A2]NPE23387.1 NADH dehydrogenase [Fusibacter sp. A1]RXV59432.1 hypothetical protein DWB64_16335 [Fusibacter sp. A1]